MDVVKLLTCIKNKNDCIKYFRQLQSLKSCNFANVSLKKIIGNFRAIIDYEFQNDCNNYEEKVAFVIYEGILTSSSMADDWATELKSVAALLKHWFDLCNGLMKQDLNKWWKYFVKVLSFIEESGIKHQSICDLILPHLTGDLLELVISDLLPWSAVKRILRALNCIASNSSRELRAQLSTIFQTHFAQLAQLLIKCGDVVGQSLLLETLLRFLKHRSDRISRIRASQLWFPQTEDWNQAIKIFQDRTFSNFDTDCRIFLNAVNQVTGLVTSVDCYAAYIGDLQLLNVEENPSDAFWVDFNRGPRTLSVSFDAGCLLQPDTSSSEVWETITVDKQIVTAVTIVRSAGLAEMRMCLRSAPEYTSVLSEASIQMHGHTVRLQFRMNAELQCVNRALADIFTEVFKELDEYTLNQWINRRGVRECSVMVQRVSKMRLPAKRPRLSDSDNPDTVVDNTGQSNYSPLAMKPPPCASMVGRAVPPIGRVSVKRTVHSTRSNNRSRGVTPAVSVVSSTSTSELAQLPEKLRQYNCAVYTKEVDALALSPALTNITEENSSAVQSVVPSLLSLSSHCIHLPSVCAGNKTIRQHGHQKSMKFNLQKGKDVSLLDEIIEDQYKSLLENEKIVLNKNRIVENILMEAFKPENTICEKIEKPIVLKKLDSKLMPQTISLVDPSVPESRSFKNNKVLKNTDVQRSAPNEENSNILKKSKQLNFKPEKPLSEISNLTNVLNASKASIQLLKSQEIQTHSSQTEKADRLFTKTINVTVKPDKPQKVSTEPVKQLKQSTKLVNHLESSVEKLPRQSDEVKNCSSNIDKPQSQVSKARISPSKTSEVINVLLHNEKSEVDNSDSGIIVTGVFNSQHNSLLIKNSNHKEYSSDVSVILDTPGIQPKSVGSKHFSKKTGPKKSSLRNKQHRIFKSRKKYMVRSSDDEDDVIQPTEQKTHVEITPNSVNNRNVLNNNEAVDSDDSFLKKHQIDVDNFFKQSIANMHPQTNENPDIAFCNNFSSSDTDKSEIDLTFEPSTSEQPNVHVKSLNSNAVTLTHFGTVAEESDSVSKNKCDAGASSSLEEGKKVRQLGKNNNVTSINTDNVEKTHKKIITPHCGEKKRRKLYSPKDSLSSFEFDNPQQEDDEVAKTKADCNLTLRQKLNIYSPINFSSTTSFDEIDKGTHTQLRRARNRIRNKKLITKQQTKEVKKTSKRKSSIKENFNVYNFSEDPQSSRKCLLGRKKLESFDCKEKLMPLGRSNKLFNDNEHSDSTDEFKASKVTSKKKRIIKCINRRKKVEDNLLENERMREAPAHSNCVDLDHSLCDSDNVSPQADCRQPTLARLHRTLQMEADCCENKSDKVNMQIDAERIICDAQTKDGVEILCERSVSSSDEFLIEKVKRRNKEYNEKKSHNNCNSDKLLDTSTDTLPSLIIESVKRVDVFDNVNKVLEVLTKHMQEDFKTASLNNTKDTESHHSVNRDCVKINGSSEDMEVEFILHKTQSNPNTKEQKTHNSTKEQRSDDKIIFIKESNVINLFPDVSPTVDLVKDISETVNLDCIEMNKSSNRKMKSFDTVGCSPIRAHSYSSEDIAPTVHNLERTVSPRKWKDDEQDTGLPPDMIDNIYPVSGDKSLFHDEYYFLESTCKKQKPNETACEKVEEHIILMVDANISSQSQPSNENTKNYKTVKDSQQSIITSSEIHQEKPKKIFITGHKKHSEVVQQSNHRTNDSGPLDVTKQNPVNQHKVKHESLQKSIVSTHKDFKTLRNLSTCSGTYSKELQEVIAMGNNNYLKVHQQEVIRSESNLKEVQLNNNMQNSSSQSPSTLFRSQSKISLLSETISSSIENVNTDKFNSDRSTSLFFDMSKLTARIFSPISEALSPPIENVIITELNSNLQKHRSSPCSESTSTSLFFDMSKMTANISPISETKFGQKIPEQSTREVEVETKNNSVGGDAIRTSASPALALTRDFIKMSSQNVDCSSQDSADTQIKGLFTSISKQLRCSGKSKYLDSTHESNPFQEKPAISDANSAYVTNWLNNMPQGNNNKNKQTFLNMQFEQLLETFDNELKEKEAERNKRWKTVIEELQHQTKQWYEKMKHTVVENLQADDNAQRAALAAMADAIAKWRDIATRQQSIDRN